MSSLLFLPLLALLVGVGVGVLLALLLGRAARASERQAAAGLVQQAETRAAEHAARTQELAALRVEHAALAEQREAHRSAAEELRVAHARVETELASLRSRQLPLEDTAARIAEEHRQLQRELGEAREALQAATTQLAADRDTVDQLLRAERAATAERVQAEREAAEARLVAARCAAESLLAAERKAADDKLALLAEARIELGNQFKTLAGEIFEEKSKRFGEQNHTQIDTLLRPLRDKLGEFQLKVESLKEDGVSGRSELKTHIDGLRSLNERLSTEAQNLVSALKGSSKTQGDWGEVLLERMLDDSGLRKGEEYRVQESFTREDGSRARPDVILNLPGDKHLVVDAKVSLLDYNAYCECDNETSRALSLARHIGSLREHIRGLSKRKYQTLYQLQSIDFVVMFVPIEPAYLLALSKDGRLWQEAWENDVLLVSPGTLFPVIRTVAHLWRQEQQNRNVQEIVYRGGELYDKLAAFAGDLSKIGDGLDTARTSYDKAMNKLRTGKGNAIRQAEMLKGLGVKPSKQMPKDMLEALQDELAHTLVEETDVRVVEEEKAGAGGLFE